MKSDSLLDKYAVTKVELISPEEDVDKPCGAPALLLAPPPMTLAPVDAVARPSWALLVEDETKELLEAVGEPGNPDVT